MAKPVNRNTSNAYNPYELMRLLHDAELQGSLAHRKLSQLEMQLRLDTMRESTTYMKWQACLTIIGTGASLMCTLGSAMARTAAKADLLKDSLDLNPFTLMLRVAAKVTSINPSATEEQIQKVVSEILQNWSHIGQSLAEASKNLLEAKRQQRQAEETAARARMEQHDQDKAVATEGVRKTQEALKQWNDERSRAFATIAQKFS